MVRIPNKHIGMSIKNTKIKDERSSHQRDAARSRRAPVAAAPCSLPTTRID